jgi:hypothetical protein
MMPFRSMALYRRILAMFQLTAVIARPDRREYRNDPSPNSTRGRSPGTARTSDEPGGSEGHGILAAMISSTIGGVTTAGTLRDRRTDAVTTGGAEIRTIFYA